MSMLFIRRVVDKLNNDLTNHKYKNVFLSRFLVYCIVKSLKLFKTIKKCKKIINMQIVDTLNTKSCILQQYSKED